MSFPDIDSSVFDLFFIYMFPSLNQDFWSIKYQIYYFIATAQWKVAKEMMSKHIQSSFHNGMSGGLFLVSVYLSHAFHSSHLNHILRSIWFAIITPRKVIALTHIVEIPMSVIQILLVFGFLVAVVEVAAV